MALCDALTGFAPTASASTNASTRQYARQQCRGRGLPCCFWTRRASKKSTTAWATTWVMPFSKGWLNAEGNRTRNRYEGGAPGRRRFVILLRDIEGLSAAERIAQTLIDAISQPSLWCRHTARGTSIGMGLYPDHGSSREQLKLPTAQSTAPRTVGWVPGGKA